MGVSERRSKIMRRTVRAVSAKESAHADHASHEALRPLIMPTPRPCSLVPTTTILLYSPTVSQTLRRSFPASSRTNAQDHLPRRQAMYACVPGTRCGFFEGVCIPSSATAHLHDPLLPLDSRIDSWSHALVAHRSGFMQNRTYGLSRMHLPRRLVNEPAVDAPNPSGWHHRCCPPVGEQRGLAERNFYVGRREHGTGPPFPGGACQGGRGRCGRDAGLRLRQPHQTVSRSSARPRRR